MDFWRIFSLLSPSAHGGDGFYRRQLTCLLLLLALGCVSASICVASQSPIANYQFQVLEQDGISQIGDPRQIIEDHHGFLWFAGFNGLARYDGAGLEIFKHDPDDPNSLYNNNITVLLVDSFDNLWIATNAGLQRYDEGLDIFVGYNNLFEKHDLGYLVVDSLQEVEPGILWVTIGGNGIWQLNVRSNQLSKVNTFVEIDELGARVFDIELDSRGRIWLAYGENGLAIYDTKTQKTTKVKGLESELESIWHDPYGLLWIATDGAGVYTRDESGILTHYPAETTGGLDSNSVEGFAGDANGNVYIATDGGGVSYFHRKEKRFYSFQPSPRGSAKYPGNKIHYIYSSPSGDIWFYHFPAAVTQLNPYSVAFTNVQHDPADDYSLVDNAILSVAEQSDGKIWIGTESGLNLLDRKTNKVKRFQSEFYPDIASGPITSIAIDVDDVWFGLYNGSVGRVSPKEMISQFLPSERRSQSKTGAQWAMIVDSQNNVWMKGNDLLRYNKTIDQFKEFSIADAIGLSTVNDIFVSFEDSIGSFWFGTASGLVSFEPELEKFTYLGAEDFGDAVRHGVRAIAEDARGDLWFTDMENGLYRYSRSQNKIKLWGIKQGLPDSSAMSLLIDDNGMIWVGTAKGLSRFDPKSEKFTHFDEAHGMPGSMINRAAQAKSRSGELMFGTTQGLTILDPNKLKTNLRAPPVILTNFYLFNERVQPGEGNNLLPKSIRILDQIVLQHDHSVFSFDFRALNYRMPDKNQYAYQMLGFDKQWVYVGEKMSATYTNLDAGKYTFRVKAANNDGVWNEEGASISLIILPPWWETWWAYCLYCLFGLFIIASFFYRQVLKRRSLEALNAVLEEKVLLRTKELRQKNSDIEAMLSHVRQGLFTITETGLIHHEYSKYLEEIFELSSLANKPALPFILKYSNMSNHDKDRMGAVLHTMLGGSALNYQFNSHLLMSESIQSINGKEKHLNLEWNPIVENGLIVKLMVTVRDITRLKAAEEDASTQRRELEIVGKILKLSPKVFLNYINSSLDQVSVNISMIESSKRVDERLLTTLFRNIHTIKGNSQTLGFDELSDTAHDIESKYSEYRNQQSHFDCELWVSHLRVLEYMLKHYLSVYNNLLNHDNSENLVTWSDEIIETVQECLDSITVDSEKQKLEPLQVLVDQANSLDFEEALKVELEAIPAIAKALGKPIPRVTFEVGELRVKNDFVTLIKNVFMHILRNSIDHGIESIDERVSKGKPDAGSIRIYAEGGGAKVAIVISDDGAGLAMSKLFEKGVSDGLWTREDKVDPRRVAEIVFASGVSTKNEVTDISGRGVGLEAVRQFLTSKDGDINIRFKGETISGYQDFEFVVSLPRTMVVLPVSIES